ncbi:hypothetical protein [Radicibacter daui]|uniref:hypothetical protein n=1 Tax=Radicibacter daui TaxID=3064829 RepID=UPI004046C63B
MINDTRFSQDEIFKLLDQAMVYMCDCPGQVARMISLVREAHDYQGRCLEDRDNLASTHETIKRALEQCHSLLENCLETVIENEGWDRETLEMPEALRRRMIGDKGPQA